MRLDGRRVLLTGASGGLGHAIARALRARGASLVLSGRRTDVLDALAAETGAEAIAADLSARDGVDRLVAQVGDVDVLVANAGLPADGAIDDYTVEQIDRALDVNLRSPILLAKALMGAMVARGEGHIVLISSSAGKVATTGSALYSATKFGLRGFGHALRADLHAAGVGVSVVAPYFISDAGLFAEADVKLPPGLGPKKPADVGAAVVRAIERNRAEIEVAPVPLKVATAIGSAAPGLAAIVNRRLGADDIADAIVESHRPKR
jgi:short-subunit dehydrogenase